DDCVPGPSWLHAIIHAFDDARVGAVTGRVSPLGSGLWNAAMPSSETRRRITANQKLEWPWEPGSGNNMAFRRDILLDIGGFDLRFGPGSPCSSGEDLDVFLKVLESDRDIVYEPAATVGHEPLRSLGLVYEIMVF